MIIKYRAERENKNADALSRSPRDPPPQCGVRQGDFQVAVVRSDDDFSATLEADPVQTSTEATDYAAKQCKYDELKEVVDFPSEGRLSGDSKRAKIVASQETLFSLILLTEYSTMLTPRVTIPEE